MIYPIVAVVIVFEYLYHSDSDPSQCLQWQNGKDYFQVLAKLIKRYETALSVYVCVRVSVCMYV